VSTGMYSPKIREDLIPYVYRLAHHIGKPMTFIVNYILSSVIDQLKEKGFFETIESEERAIKEVSNHIVKLVRSKKRDDRKRMIEILRNMV
jgi:hypothetical protein